MARQIVARAELPSWLMPVRKAAELLGYADGDIWRAIKLGFVQMPEEGKVFAKDASLGVEYMREVKP